MNAAKTKAPKVRRAKSKAKVHRAKRKAGIRAADAERAFRFNAAQTVQIRFAGEKKPESFRVDDMVEASMVTLAGPAKHTYQYRLVSNDKTGPGGAERYFWFFDPRPVGAADPLDPSLWRPAPEQSLDGQEVVKECSGNFSTRSVTSYDGSGVRHVVKLDGRSTYCMRLELNGKREFCESLPVMIGKGDVLIVSGSGGVLI
jgi:hypothetical protein